MLTDKNNFVFKLIAALVGCAGIYWLLSVGFSNSASAVTFLPLMFYVVLIILYLFFSAGILTGFLKGNAVKVSERQFPEVYDVVAKQCSLLGLKHIPEVYILQRGGVLNAFAMRFAGDNYIVLYSDVVEEAMAEATFYLSIPWCSTRILRLQTRWELLLLFLKKT
ncbi:hypothetical protein [Desertivirga xinjiangensis]|uniref:hypothetical protein n=1 Tax=Desertivirga xinjiangensis TaxID=539206 RepID=UPI00210EF733|nr:hypothetical protein [Pedobacter xinjiangensis]